MAREKISLQQRHGFFRTLTAIAWCGSDHEFQAAMHVFIGPQSAQETVDGIGIGMGE